MTGISQHSLDGMMFGTGASFMLLTLFWTILWKGLALWHAGRRGDAWWFVALLVINTFGILELVYLFAIAKRTPQTLFSKE